MAQNQQRPFRIFTALRQSKDPTVFTVLFEDSAGLLGLIAATFGVAGVHLFGFEWTDGAASIVIAAILARGRHPARSRDQGLVDR